MANSKAAPRAAERGADQSPVDQLITAMARLVDDREMSPRIRHMFFNQGNGNLQVSLDMHAPVEN